MSQNTVLQTAARPAAELQTSWPMREGVAAFIAVVLTISVAVVVYLGAAAAWAHDPSAFNRFKELLAIVAGLFGTVLGYYFGRAAGDLTAAAANKAAAASEQKSDNATAAATDARLKQEKAKMVAKGAVDAAANALAAPAPTNEGRLEGAAAYTTNSRLEGALMELQNARKLLDTL